MQAHGKKLNVFNDVMPKQCDRLGMELEIGARHDIVASLRVLRPTVLEVGGATTGQLCHSTLRSHAVRQQTRAGTCYDIVCPQQLKPGQDQQIDRHACAARTVVWRTVEWAARPSLGR